MKVAALTSLIIAALGATSAMAQSQPMTRDQVRADTSRAVSSGDIERNDLNYGTEWATNPSSRNYDRHVANSMSAGSMSSSMDAGSTGAAGRPYDGSSSGGSASRSDVASDRDSAMRSDRWIFNDLDGLQRLEPGWNSHEGRVYRGSADAPY